MLHEAVVAQFECHRAPTAAPVRACAYVAREIPGEWKATHNKGPFRGDTVHVARTEI